MLNSQVCPPTKNSKKLRVISASPILNGIFFSVRIKRCQNAAAGKPGLPHGNILKSGLPNSTCRKTEASIAPKRIAFASAKMDRSPSSTPKACGIAHAPRASLNASSLNTWLAAYPSRNLSSRNDSKQKHSDCRSVLCYANNEDIMTNALKPTLSFQTC